MQRWDHVQQIAIPCNKLKLTVRATTLPRKIKLYGANMRYGYFIPSPIIYKNCLRYGHVEKICKAKKVCENCAEVHDLEEKCKNAIKCKSCKENHKIKDPICKERKKQRDIKKIMVVKRLPYHLAMKEYHIDEGFPKANDGPSYAEIKKKYKTN